MVSSVVIETDDGLTLAGPGNRDRSGLPTDPRAPSACERGPSMRFGSRVAAPGVSSRVKQLRARHRVVEPWKSDMAHRQD